MIVLGIGQPHPGLVGRVPLPEGMLADLMQGEPELVVILDQPDASQVAAVVHGPLVLGLVPLLPWGYLWLLSAELVEELEAPFSPMASPPSRRALSPAPGGTAPDNLHLRIAVVQASTGVVLGLRMAPLPMSFTTVLRRLHEATLENGDTYGRARWWAEVDRHQAAHPSVAEQFVHATAQCRLGDNRL